MAQKVRGLPPSFTEEGVNYWSLREAGRQLGVSYETVRNWILWGHIPEYTHPHYRAARYVREDEVRAHDARRSGRELPAGTMQRVERNGVA